MLDNQGPGKNKALMIVVGVSVLATSIVTGLLVNIFEKKQEAKNPFYRVVELNDDIDDPAVWGKNFPQQYDGYKRTVDMVRTKFGGSESIPRVPMANDRDPRKVVAQQKLELDPRLVTLWSGYAFSKDFREERGHAYMLEDQIYTERQVVVQQPGTCLNCHASTYLTMKKLGNGDLTKGFEAMNHMPYQEAVKNVQHPVSCIDCHDASNMKLRVTRPAFMEGIKAYKAHEGIANYDVNKDATRQEMRTFVCAQCHVEYYFKGPDKRLTFPWAKGLKADEILSYYDEKETYHKDWVHKETGAEVLKAQHPEFEMYMQGVHAKSGVSCVDCHMPYQRMGAMKITDHHIRSPLLNINRACQTCHNVSEDQLAEKVDTIQQRHTQLRNLAMDAVVDLIHSLKPYKEDSSGSAKLAEARKMQRKAQFLLDFSEAENSTGFHAPQEGSRVLGTAIDYARKGQNMVHEFELNNKGAPAKK